MAFTKREFDKITQRASQCSTETAMCITQQKVTALDLGLVTGKYVEELRRVANQYERMWQREQDGEPRRELPYAG